MQIGVVGFGYIGSVLGAVLAQRGQNVVAVEPSTDIRDAVNAGQAPVAEPGLEELIGAAVDGGQLTITGDFAVVADCDVVLVTVGTPLRSDGSADLTDLETAVQQLAEHHRPDALLIIKSTVPPLTTESVVAPILREKTGGRTKVAFCPERLAEGKAIEELRTIPVVVGGVDEESTRAATTFWREAVGLAVVDAGSARAAELVKLADNAWIDLNIAFAHELARLSDVLDLDVLDVIRAANTLPKGDHHVNILTPSVGVGGYCLTKDPWFLHSFARGHGVDLESPRLSRTVNDEMPEYAASLIDEHLASEAPGNGVGGHVAVLGLAFKNDTGDCRFTPTLPAIRDLRARGHEVTVFDPWVAESEMRPFASCDRAASIDDAVADASCVAFLAGHAVFRDYPLERLSELARPGALVFDGRMFFSKEEIKRMEAMGLRYKGVGR